MSRSPTPGPAPEAPSGSQGPDRGGYRKAYWISLGVSAVLHLIAIVFYTSLMREIPAGLFTVGGDASPPNPEGMELVNLQELPEDDIMEIIPPEEPEPEEAPAPSPVITPRAGVPGDPGEATDTRVPVSAAERLRPQEGDLRLWAPPDPELNVLSREEVMRLQLLAALESMADSAAMAEEIARRAKDWTYTDGDGKRWGVSPGKIHLGDVTLPMPFSFGAKGEDVQRIWEWDQIDQSAARGSVMQSWKDRDEAIRARMNAERKPDTTGVRR